MTGSRDAWLTSAAFQQRIRPPANPGGDHNNRAEQGWRFDTGQYQPNKPSAGGNSTTNLQVTKGFAAS
ncbi:hypothetical protein [Zhongshania sp.]|uniref:hypothetical protein n=1 Tax=Zhongshania sp. TaxID=1971902 RepID=UPI003566274A